MARYCRKLRCTNLEPCPTHPVSTQLPASQRGYDAWWQRESKAFLAAHERCAINGPHCTTEATVVDHITPHKGNQQLLRDRANWQPACRDCNSWKAATREGAFGNAVSA